VALAAAAAALYLRRRPAAARAPEPSQREPERVDIVAVVDDLLGA
jgi:hypothetical protein